MKPGGPSKSDLSALRFRPITSFVRCVEMKQSVIEPEDARTTLGNWLAGRRDEAAVILYLDEARRVTGHFFCAGGIDRVSLPVREIVRRALALDCAGFLLGHNHPNGDPRPSKYDILVTRLLHNAARVLDFDLIDHCIVSGDKMYSFRAQGLM